MTVRKGIYWVIRITVFVLVVKFAFWAYDAYLANNRVEQQEEVLDIDKQCLMDADTSYCMCRHRWTKERLDIPHAECMERAGQP